MKTQQMTFFHELKQSELWYGLLPELLEIERKWLGINGQKVFASLTETQRPFLATAITLWEQSLIVAAEGKAYFAAHSLRSILERIAFLWATSKEIGHDPESIITSFESANRKTRRRTTDDIIEAAQKKDSSIGVVYNDMLSRYFSHLSHLDIITIEETKKNKTKLKTGAQILPLLLIFDVGNCLVNVIEHLLRENHITAEPFTGGRTGHEFKAVNYIRAATHVMCEKHSRQKAVSLSLLINNIADMKGQIGLTDIYRGGMEIHRYGSPKEKPGIEQIKELSIFAIGRADPKRIAVNIKAATLKGEKYSLRWPKEWDVTYAAIGMVARNTNQNYEIFDYVSSFVRLMK